MVKIEIEKWNGRKWITQKQRRIQMVSIGRPHGKQLDKQELYLGNSVQIDSVSAYEDSIKIWISEIFPAVQS